MATEFTLTEAQKTSIEKLCIRYNVAFDPDQYMSSFEMPGWAVGWVGPIFVGVSPDGEVRS
jgi:hypothetical protein